MQLCILIFSVVLILLGTYLFITQAHRSEVWEYTAIAAQIIGIVGLITVWHLHYFIPDASAGKDMLYAWIYQWVDEKINTYLGAFICLVYIVLLYYVQQLYHQSKIKKDGIVVNAKVTAIETKEKKADHIKIEYKVQDKTIVKTLIKSKHDFVLQQEVPLIYSASAPTIFMLKSDETI